MREQNETGSQGELSEDVGPAVWGWLRFADSGTDRSGKDPASFCSRPDRSCQQKELPVVRTGRSSTGTRAGPARRSSCRGWLGGWLTAGSGRRGLLFKSFVDCREEVTGPSAHPEEREHDENEQTKNQSILSDRLSVFASPISCSIFCTLHFIPPHITDHCSRVLSGILNTLTSRSQPSYVPN